MSIALIAVTNARCCRVSGGIPRTDVYVSANMSCQIASTLNGSRPTTSGVIRCTISPTARMPSGPGRDRNGPCASPIPTSPESVVSFTMTSLTWAMVEFDTRTGCARGADRK
jgi:hypothetical protein